MMGAGARPGAERLAGVPRLENEEAADRGRGEAAGGGGLGVGCGRGGPNELGFGTKSKRGPRRGATPYCMAISRPLSRGILKTC